MANEFDVIVYGSLNMDFVSYVSHLPRKGETVSTKIFKMVPGGKAANQAVAASRLGSTVAMVGKVGNDQIGQSMKDALAQDHVNHESVFISEESNTGTAVITVDVDGENTITTFLGANAYLCREDIKQSLLKLQSSKAVILQLEMEKDVAEYIIEKAYENNKRIILNLAPVIPLGEDLLQKVDLLIVNETEASQLTNYEVHSIESAKQAGVALRNNGIKNVIVTLGEKGAVLAYGEGTFHIHSPKVKSVDSTAAGDCFVAAVAHFWQKLNDLKAAVSEAVIVAALSVTKEGAQTSLPTTLEYLQFKEQMEVKENDVTNPLYERNK